MPQQNTVRTARYLSSMDRLSHSFFLSLTLFLSHSFSHTLFLSSPPVRCTSGSSSRLTHSVTVEEDNCCGCNVLAVRRHFLDQDLKQVQIVYMSCHDAVSGLSGLRGRELSPLSAAADSQVHSAKISVFVSLYSCTVH